MATGDLVTATGSGAIAYVTREDCARAAAAALASSAAGRVTLDITGPAAVTLAEVAAIAAAITGRAIKHVPVDGPSLNAGLVGAGLPAVVAELLVSFDLGAARGDLALATTTVLD